MEEHEWKFIPRLIVLDSMDEDGFLKSGFALKEKRKVCISNLLFLDFYLYLLEQCDPRWGREIGGIMPSKRLGKSNKKNKKKEEESFLSYCFYWRGGLDGKSWKWYCCGSAR